VEKKRILHFIWKIISGTATREEEDAVNEHFQEAFYMEDWDEEELGNKKEVEEKILSRVNEYVDTDRTKRFRIKDFFRYAAVLAMFVGIGILIKQYLPRLETGSESELVYDFLQPGSDEASLELSDGTVLNLADLEVGENIERSGFHVTKTNKGNVEYVFEDVNTHLNNIKWNTLKTPVGGKYQILLPDGTKVWLNAASSLSFPSRFASDQRIVKASGEVYFEVAQDESLPFLVESKDVVIKVLGTSFNLSSYEGEATSSSSTVALLEGAIRLKSNTGESINLTPGQKAFVGSEEIGVERFDAESEIAWKNNYFIFNNQNIKNIMAVLARWYDAEVIYEGENWKDKNFTMRMSRRESIEEILSIIELTKSIKFKIERRKITVYTKEI